MKLAIMQPYFLPYIGYFQLIGAADTFVVYDNIKYTKKGWVNRNRMLRNGEDVMFSLPLAKDSDSLDIVERELAADFDREKLLNQFKGAYSKAPHFDVTFPVLARIVRNDERNLFRYIYQSITELCDHLGLATEIRISSEIDIDHDLKSQDKVLALCKARGADSYINPIGGLELYRRADFAAQSIALQFIETKPFDYPQFAGPTVPSLSIADILMFNPLNEVKDRIANGYELI
jgi:WbqC-like protein family